MRIHNTDEDATLVNDPKVKLTNEYNHASMRHPQKRRQARDGQCTQKLWLCSNEAAQKDIDDTNMIQMNQVFANHSKEEAINPLTMKEIVEA